MFTVPVVVDSYLRLPDFMLEYGDVCEEIYNDLTIANQAKLDAKRRNQWGWQDLPDSFELFDIDGDNLVLPRGYALQLKLLLREHGKRVEWVDRRRRRRGPAFELLKTPDPKFRHQDVAVQKMLKHQQGIYQAPTGAGKTVAVIRFVHRRRPLKTIILVNKISLMSQWIGGFNAWLGPGGQVGQIGSGKWVDDKRITVATLQSIWSKMKREPEFNWVAWFDDFDCVFLDECHGATAESVQTIYSNFTAADRMGVSATPDRLDDKFEIAQAIIGEVFHEDDEDTLRRRGVLVRPTVHAIRTRFSFSYWGDHQAHYDQDESEWICDKPGCKVDAPHGHKNNYQKLKDKIVSDQFRNSLVMSATLGQIRAGDHHHLIISNEVRHLQALDEMYQRMHNDMGMDVPKSFMLTGRVTGKRRAEMIAEIKSLPATVIFSTVAKEGLDIPAIDRIYLPWPESNPKMTQQKIGRGTRSVEGKDDTLIFDFIDVNVDVLKKQWRKRRFKCYDKLGIEVVM